MIQGLFNEHVAYGFHCDFGIGELGRIKTVSGFAITTLADHLFGLGLEIRVVPHSSFHQGSSLTVKSAATCCSHETAESVHFGHDFCDVLAKGIVRCATFGHVAGQHATMCEAAAGHSETLTASGFHKQTFYGPVACFTFGDVSAVPDHQACFFRLI